MNTELTTNLAGEISRLHAEAQKTAETVKEGMQAALEFAAQCGSMLSIAKEQTRGEFIAWLRDNVPAITQEHVKTYLDCFHQSQERGIILDSRRAHQLGFFDKGEMTATAKPAAKIDAGKWIGWTSNIRGWWTKTTRERPVSAWEPHERQAVKDQLKPLVDIYNQLQ